MRIDQRVAHARLGGQMYDASDRVLEKQLFHPLTVGQIELHELKPVQRTQQGQARLFEPDVVVVVQIIETDDLVSTVDQTPGNVEADEPGSTGHEYERFSRRHSGPSMSMLFLITLPRALS